MSNEPVTVNPDHVLTREFSRGAGSDPGGRGWVGGWVVHV